MQLPLMKSLLSLLLLGLVTAVQAVPQMIHYQGRVSLNGTLVNGPGEFKFALVNGDGSAVFWTNDGNSTGPNHEPTVRIILTVANGLYSVLLGDDTVAGMTPIPRTVFANADVRLRVWFDAGVANGGWQLLTPDQRIASVGYAMMAGSVPDGSITTAKLAADAVGANQIVNGSVTLQKLDFSLSAPGEFLSTDAFGAIWKAVNWTNLAGLPGGFADGVDNDTLFTAGAGLSLAGTEFRLNFAGSGVANTATRSDHHHLGADWTGSFSGSAFNIQNTAADGLAMSGLVTGTAGVGLTGIATGASGIGVAGVHAAATGIAPGVRGETASADLNARGVFGLATSTSGLGSGLWGETLSAGGYGLRALNSVAGGTGAYITGGAYGVRAVGSSEGARGTSTSGYGVAGITTDGTGIYGSNGDSDTVGHAGYFEGRVRVTKGLTADGPVTAVGAGATDAVYGQLASGTGAAIHGVHANGKGVWGQNTATSAAGILGSDAGVVAIGHAGVSLTQAATSTALRIGGGQIRVDGAGVNTPTAAFIHEVTEASNFEFSMSEIDHPMCNGAPNAILVVTAHARASTDGSSYGSGIPERFGVYYRTNAAGSFPGGTANRWVVFSMADTMHGIAITPGHKFNVLIIKP